MLPIDCVIGRLCVLDSLFSCSELCRTRSDRHNHLCTVLLQNQRKRWMPQVFTNEHTYRSQPRRFERNKFIPRRKIARLFEDAVGGWINFSVRVCEFPVLK